MVKVKSEVPSTKQVAPTGPLPGALRPGANLKVSPEAPTPGRAAKITLDLVDGAGRKATALEDLHTKPVHLIAVSEDLSDFLHVHPQSTGGSAFAVDATFKLPSFYRVWTEFQPKGARSATIDVANVATKGAAPTMVALVVDGDSSKSAGTTRAALSGAGGLQAGRKATLTLDFTDRSTGRPAKLEPLLGAPAHAIVVSSNRDVFQHLHGALADAPAPAAGAHAGHDMGGARPAGAATKISFETTFPAPGLYKVFVQAQRDSQVLTVPFVVQVG